MNAILIDVSAMSSEEREQVFDRRENRIEVSRCSDCITFISKSC
jgi:hypothetical protein